MNENLEMGAIKEAKSIVKKVAGKAVGNKEYSAVPVSYFDITSPPLTISRKKVSRMKKFVLLSVLLIGVVTTPLFAVTTGVFQMSMLIAAELSTSSTITAYSFVSTGATEADVGTFTIITNSKIGYTFSLASANSFALATSDVTSTVAYTLGLYSGATKLTAETLPYSYSFSGKTPKGGLVYTLKISYAPAISAGIGGEWLEAGNYTDTITFTVMAR